LSVYLARTRRSRALLRPPCARRLITHNRRLYFSQPPCSVPPHSCTEISALARQVTQTLPHQVALHEEPVARAHCLPRCEPARNSCWQSLKPKRMLRNGLPNNSIACSFIRARLGWSNEPALSKGRAESATRHPSSQLSDARGAEQPHIRRISSSRRPSGEQRREGAWKCLGRPIAGPVGGRSPTQPLQRALRPRRVLEPLRLPCGSSKARAILPGRQRDRSAHQS
jgi:hypothetical protein